MELTIKEMNYGEAKQILLGLKKVSSFERIAELGNAEFFVRNLLF